MKATSGISVCQIHVSSLFTLIYLADLCIGRYLILKDSDLEWAKKLDQNILSLQSGAWNVFKS